MQVNLALLGALFAYSLACVTTAPPLSDKQQLLKLEDECGRALKDEDRSTLESDFVSRFAFIEPGGLVLNRETK